MFHVRPILDSGPIDSPYLNKNLQERRKKPPTLLLKTITHINHFWRYRFFGSLHPSHVIHCAHGTPSVVCHERVGHCMPKFWGNDLRRHYIESMSRGLGHCIESFPTNCLCNHFRGRLKWPHIARYCDTITAVSPYRAIPFQGG